MRKNLREFKPAAVNQQCFVYKFQCNLCDAGYVGYTRGHLHERVDGHKQKWSSICEHYVNAHNSECRTCHLVFWNNFTCLLNVTVHGKTYFSA